MQRIFICLRDDHNLWLVVLAALVCITGSWITIRLFERVVGSEAKQRAGWLFLTGVAAGGSIWCTHFVAMLGYIPNAEIHFDALLTGASFFIAIFGTMAGFAVASIRSIKIAPEIGGALVGLAVAAMHYVGMAAYAIDGLIMWSPAYVNASIILGAIFGAVAVNRAVRPTTAYCRHGAIALLTLAIVSMHFTGMAAIDVQPFAIYNEAGISADMISLAASIGGVGLLIVGMGVTSFLLDQSEREESLVKLRRMALHDPLTGLPNRAYFTDHLTQAVGNASQNGGRFAVIAIDLDRFKEINDQFGYDAGDEALLIFSRRVGAKVSGTAFFARVGGDEFVIVKTVESDDDLTEFVRILSESATEKTYIRDVETMLGASLGIAIYPQDAEDPETLIKAADLAMYRAKSDPTTNVGYYEPGLDDIARRKRALATDLRKAIDTEALVLNYQVQKDIRDDSTIGYEVLLRWNHPEHGSISPAEFIPLAEETGLIVPLGEWVLRKACMDASIWPSTHKVSVNISAVQFSHGALNLIIEDALWKSGLSATRLEIEITESVLMSDMDRTVKMLRDIQSLGVTVAMDDFGTGYSSLANLQAFPFDKIKLDRGFIWKLEQSNETKAIIRAVLALGRSLNVPVLAEGVETAAQRDFLLEEGCFEVQGYFYGRPALLEDIDMDETPKTATVLKIVATAG